jgi:MoxR-like ATPase
MAEKNHPVPSSIDATLKLLGEANYLADRSLATVLFLALKMNRPIFLEGEAGVGKTEIAKVLSETLGRRLIRLQCYEGLDVASAVYEWNYAAQMIAIRAAEASGDRDSERIEHDVFSERFLIKRPLLQALEPDAAGAPVLLIDELDRSDEAFEAFLLEVLADFQVTIPESPGVAETLDWATALSELDAVALDPAAVSDTLGVLLKYQDDIAKLEGGKVKELLDQVQAELRAAE